MSRYIATAYVLASMWLLSAIIHASLGSPDGVVIGLSVLAFFHWVALAIAVGIAVAQYLEGGRDD